MTGLALWLAPRSERCATARRLPDSELEAGLYSGSAPVAVVEATDLGLGHDPPMGPRYSSVPRLLDGSTPWCHGESRAAGFVGRGAIVSRRNAGDPLILPVPSRLFEGPYRGRGAVLGASLCRSLQLPARQEL